MGLRPKPRRACAPERRSFRGFWFFNENALLKRAPHGRRGALKNRQDIIITGRVRITQNSVIKFDHFFEIFNPKQKRAGFDSVDDVVERNFCQKQSFLLMFGNCFGLRGCNSLIRCLSTGAGGGARDAE